MCHEVCGGGSRVMGGGVSHASSWCACVGGGGGGVSHGLCVGFMNDKSGVWMGVSHEACLSHGGVGAYLGLVPRDVRFDPRLGRGCTSLEDSTHDSTLQMHDSQCSSRVLNNTE